MCISDQSLAPVPPPYLVNPTFNPPHALKSMRPVELDPRGEPSVLSSVDAARIVEVWYVPATMVECHEWVPVIPSDHHQFVQLQIRPLASYCRCNGAFLRLQAYGIARPGNPSPFNLHPSPFTAGLPCSLKLRGLRDLQLFCSRSCYE